MAITKFNGHIYWGTPESAEGWETKIGDFHILSHKKRFMRYIRHSDMKSIREERKNIAELSGIYGFATSPVFQTYHHYHTFEKFFEVHIVEPNAQKFLEEREEFPSKIRSPDYNPKEVMVSISQQRPYNSSNYVALDINTKIKSIHKELILGLENILKVGKDEKNELDSLVASPTVV